MLRYTVLIALALAAVATAGVIPESPKEKRAVLVSHAPVATVVAAHAPIVAHAPLIAHAPVAVAHAPAHAVSHSYSSVSISHPVAVHHAPLAVAHAPVVHAPLAVAHAPVLAHPVYASHFSHAYLH